MVLAYIRNSPCPDLQAADDKFCGEKKAHRKKKVYKGFPHSLFAFKLPPHLHLLPFQASPYLLPDKKIDRNKEYIA